MSDIRKRFNKYILVTIPSAHNPRLTKGVLNVAVGTAYTKSKRPSVVTPIPIQGPLTNPIRSFGKLIMEEINSLKKIQSN